MIDLEGRMEAAVLYLEETDLEHARLRAVQSRLQEVRKTILAFGFECATGAAEARRQAAHKTKEYLEHIERQYEADLEFHAMDNKRWSAVRMVDLYRTLCANQRRGN